MSIDYDISSLRSTIEAGIDSLPENERRVVGQILDRLVARIKEIAVARASGDTTGEEVARKRLEELRLGLADSARLIKGRERLKAAEVWADVFDEAKHLLDEATRYAMGVAVEALAGAALKAFAGA